jgi:hypothetical protein
MAAIGYILDLSINSDWRLNHSVPLPALTTITSAKFYLKANETDADGAALISKSITTSYTAGQGQITDDGAADGVADMVFEAAKAQTAGLVPWRSYYYEFRVVTNANIEVPTEKGILIPQ